MPKSSTPIPEVKKTEIVYSGYFDVRVDHLQLLNGAQRPYTILELNAHAAVVIAQTKDKQFVVTQEYRHPIGKWLLTCAGGRIDTGESPIEAAKRELLEETGYGGGTFSLLGHLYPLPAVTNQQIFFVLAQDVEYIKPPTPDPFELIHVQLKSAVELLAEIKSGNPIDGVFFSGLGLSGLVSCQAHSIGKCDK